MPLRYLTGIFLLFCVVASQVLATENATVVYYEPHSTTLSGKVIIGESIHPNGTLMRYPILYLSTAIIVAADPLSKINMREENVLEIQMYSADSNLHSRLLRSNQKAITVEGKLFHGHTAWHTRNIVMKVTAIK